MTEVVLKLLYSSQHPKKARRKLSRAHLIIDPPKNFMSFQVKKLFFSVIWFFSKDIFMSERKRQKGKVLKKSSHTQIWKAKKCVVRLGQDQKKTRDGKKKKIHLAFNNNNFGGIVNIFYDFIMILMLRWYDCVDSTGEAKKNTLFSSALIW